MRRAVGVTTRTLLSGVLVVAMLGLLGLGLLPHVLGYRTVVMLTGSMRPLIPTGSVAIVVPEPVSEVRVGQIITFEAPLPDHRVVTHRVIDVRREAGRTLVRTKGDANNGADPWVADVHGGTAWRYRATLPWLGSVIRTLSRPTMHLAIAIGLPLLVVGWLLTDVWRRPSRRRRTGAALGTLHPAGDAHCWLVGARARPRPEVVPDPGPARPGPLVQVPRQRGARLRLGSVTRELSRAGSAR